MMCFNVQTPKIQEIDVESEDEVASVKTETDLQ